MTTAPDSILSKELREQLPRRIAHDLRTPLGLIHAAFQELTPSDADAPLLVLGQRGVRQLVHLADRLSLFARLERGEQGAIAPVDLVPIVDQALQEVAQTRPRRAVKTTRGPIPDRVVVRADADSLRAALVEVLDNAVRLAKRSVEVRVHQREAEVLIEVDDDGPGPGDPKTGGGLGLGLPMVRFIAATHGGRFELAKGPAGGARAMLVLQAEA